MGSYRTQDLGEPLAEHRFTLGTKLRVIVLLFFIGPPLVMILLGLSGTLKMGEDWNVMSYLGGAVLFVGMPAFGIKLWLDARSRDRDLVRIYDRGFVQVDRGVERFVAWSDVVSLTSDVKQTVTNGVPGPVTHRYVIATEAGATAFTHGFERIEDLAQVLRDKTAEVIEPRVQEELKAKKKVGFGPLTLSLRGVGHGGDTLRWKDASARFDQGLLVLERKGHPFCKVPIPEVANAHVLVSLIERMRELVGPAG